VQQYAPQQALSRSDHLAHRTHAPSTRGKA
jgi:hypothetical protein